MSCYGTKLIRKYFGNLNSYILIAYVEVYPAQKEAKRKAREMENTMSLQTGGCRKFGHFGWTCLKSPEGSKKELSHLHSNHNNFQGTKQSDLFKLLCGLKLTVRVGCQIETGVGNVVAVSVKL